MNVNPKSTDEVARAWGAKRQSRDKIAGITRRNQRNVTFNASAATANIRVDQDNQMQRMRCGYLPSLFQEIQLNLNQNVVNSNGRSTVGLLVREDRGALKHLSCRRGHLCLIEARATDEILCQIDNKNCWCLPLDSGLICRLADLDFVLGIIADPRALALDIDD